MCDVKILFLSYLIRLAGVNVTGNDVKIIEDDVNLIVQMSVYQDPKNNSWSICNIARKFVKWRDDWWSKWIWKILESKIRESIVFMWQKAFFQWMLLWVHPNSWHATSSLWTTLMLELDDEWFLIKSYLEVLYRYSPSIFTC